MSEKGQLFQGPILRKYPTLKSEKNHGDQCVRCLGLKIFPVKKQKSMNSQKFNLEQEAEERILIMYR